MLLNYTFTFSKQNIKIKIYSNLFCLLRKQININETHKNYIDKNV